MSKINIYVNSKNRKSDESPSNFSVIIPDDLLKIKKDEYFTLSVNSFYCYNDFYHCNENCNGFNIIVKNNLNVVSGEQMFYLPIGNPNILDIVNYINLVLQPVGLLSCSYNNIKNKITFTRLMPQSNTNFTFNINTMNVGSFLGFKNNIEILISFSGTESTNPINTNTIRALSIGIDDDISFRHNNMESNFNNSV